MAYGNWGAFVYRNGERAKQWEDATPYKETEYMPGYGQAFGIARLTIGEDGDPVPVMKPADELRAHHAVLGKDRVRLCGYKCYPRLYVDGEKREMEPFATLFTETMLNDGKTYKDVEEYKGEIDGYQFTASLRDNFVDLYLKEPDGTAWTGTCGYEYGAGHMDD